MKSLSFTICCVLIVFFCTQCGSRSENPTLSVLVVTGGHGYDTLEFGEMFRSMPGLAFDFEDKPGAWDRLGDNSGFDALVFYDMYQDIEDDEKKLFLAQFEKGTGMVFLHHSLGSHQNWPEYQELVGGKFYDLEYTDDTSLVLAYYHDINLNVNVIDTIHPVTKGVVDYEVIDEGYTNIQLMPGLHYLLETNHPQCDRYIGWTQTAVNSKVVYLMGGHDKKAYENESFRLLVENAIRWTAEKLDKS